MNRIIHAIGIAVLPAARKIDTTCVEAAPIDICTKPVMPEAVPAACGRMLTAPAMEFGSSKPLPYEITSCGRKMIAGPASGIVATKPTVRAAPITSKPMPAMIRLSIPKRWDSLIMAGIGFEVIGAALTVGLVATAGGRAGDHLPAAACDLVWQW